MLIGRHRHVRSGMISDLLFTPFVRGEEYRHREAVEHVIDFLDLQPYRDKAVGGLPYGVRKVVELGRALATEPKLLLLDEPASGLSVEETQELAFWIEDIKKQMGITILMVEHDMKLVSAVSDRVLALANGRPLALGSPKEVHVASRCGGGLSRPAPGSGGMSRAPLLKVANLESYYGPIMAIRGVTLAVAEGKVVTVLGANGAGKTTLLRTISGVMDPEKGEVWFDGKPIEGLSPDKIVRAGHRACAGGPRDLPAADRRRKTSPWAPISAPITRRSSRIWSWSTAIFRSLASAAASPPACCPAASSRCWRSGED